jgi:hypothetical protein
MRPRSLSHLADGVLLGELNTLLARDRDTTAEMLLYLGEVDRRRLYVPAGYPSMYMWCLAVLGFSEDGACQRIRGARAARQFAVILEMVADGRLHLSGLALLSRHLTRANATELLDAAAHRSKRAIERLIAERFPRADVPDSVRPLGAATGTSPVPGRVEFATTYGVSMTERASESPVPGRVDLTAAADSTADGGTSPVLGRVTSRPEPAPHSRVAPLAPERYAVQFTMDESMHAELIHAQNLLGPRVPAGQVADVFRLALKALVTQLEKRKCAATKKPRAPRPSYRSDDPRYTPADVVRTVWVRDQDQCTYVSKTGHRCEERSGLEIDHVDPPQPGVTPTADKLRLRCRAHNQYAAELRYGDGFMHQIRARAKRATRERRAQSRAGAAAQTPPAPLSLQSGSSSSASPPPPASGGRGIDGARSIETLISASATA